MAPLQDLSGKQWFSRVALSELLRRFLLSGQRQFKSEEYKKLGENQEAIHGRDVKQV